MLLVFTACGGNGNALEEPAPQPSPTLELPHEWTIEELAETIVSAGEFWNKWWASHHTFEWEHIDDSRRNWQPWDEEITPAHHPLSRGFAVVLPSSGFTSLDDIGAYLLQFYTQDWVGRGEFAEPEVSMEFMVGEHVTLFGFYGLEEYDGELFVFIQTEWSARPDWRAATHTLIEQDGNRAVVETVVPTYVHGHSQSEDMPAITYRFTFIDGRIDSGIGQLHEVQSSQDYHVLQGFDAILEGMVLSIHRAEDVDLERFGLHSIDHAILWGTPGYGEQMVIVASEPISNVSLIHFSNDWNDDAEERIYTLIESHSITDILNPSDALYIHDFMSLGTLPGSGISFYDAHGERHFFAVHHDNSDSPHWYVMWNITDQMRFEPA